MAGKDVRGPDGWENWRAYTRGLPAKGAIEVGFYSDSRVVGQIDGLGPYRFLKSCAVNDESTAGLRRARSRHACRRP